MSIFSVAFEWNVISSFISNLEWSRMNTVDTVVDLKILKEVFLLNDTHKEKLYFTQFSTRMAAWLLLIFFHMFTQSVKFCAFHYHLLKSTDV